MKTKRIYSLSRIVALAVIGVMLLGLTYLGMASGDAAVSVPQGAHAGQLTMHPCTYATEKGAYRATAERSSCPRTGQTPVTPDRAASDTHSGSLIAPVGANLSSQRWPWHNQHDVPQATGWLLTTMW